LLFIEEEHFGIDVSELIPEMHKSGLISCWAHPGKNLFYHEKDSTLSNQTLTYIVDHKIDAIEVYANKHNKHQCEIFLDYCKEHDLLVLGGSDFHGDGKGQLDYPMGEELLTAFLHKVKG
jgi:predicted metal-dependent phosphoesterase TrpH